MERWQDDARKRGTMLCPDEADAGGANTGWVSPQLGHASRILA
jgi:hypothetical protein